MGLSLGVKELTLAVYETVVEVAMFAGANRFNVWELVCVGGDGGRRRGGVDLEGLKVEWKGRKRRENGAKAEVYE